MDGLATEKDHISCFNNAHIHRFVEERQKKNARPHTLPMVKKGRNLAITHCEITISHLYAYTMVIAAKIDIS